MMTSMPPPALSIIVPVYNEAQTVAQVLDAVVASSYDKQVIVVDDGSTDGASETIGRWREQTQSHIEVVRHASNLGKGAAIRSGLALAEGEIIIVQDADLEVQPTDYPRLVEPILDGTVTVVFGSRCPSRAPWYDWTWNRLGVATLNLLVFLLFGRRITDEATCYEVMRTDLLRRLLVAHVCLLLGNLRWNFIVLDEIYDVPSGLAHWQTGNLSLDRVNRPLPRMLAVLPMMMASPKADYHRLRDHPGVREEYLVGPDFVTANGARSLDLFRLGRLSGVAWSLIGCWLVYRWAKELYGEAGGCIGLAMWCFEPSVLAFAPTVIPDVPATVAALAATYVFWHFLRRRTWPLAFWSGLLLGVAQLTKYTLLTLYVIWPILWWLRRHSKPPAPRPGRGDAAEVRKLLLIAGVSLLMINLGYGLKGCLRPMGEFEFVSRTFAGEPPAGMTIFDHGLTGNRFRNTWLATLLVPLPRDYVGGIDMQRRDFEGRFRSYLAGEWRGRGWWYYYLYALAVKVPLGIWALAICGFVLAGTRPFFRATWTDDAALLVTGGGILAFVSSQTGFNHHMRYILPIFPFVFISAGKLGAFWSTPVCLPHAAKVRVLVIVLLFWAGAASLSVYPHSMSYFNELAGGPMRGHDHLLYSNIDWGQDLLFLKDWIAKHPEARPLGLAYCNDLDPATFGVVGKPVPPGRTGLFRDDLTYQSRLGPQPGYYAVSVQLIRESDGRYGYFRDFEPIARAGYSIYIYRISPSHAAEYWRKHSLP
jgi:hypothetical protein